MDSEAHDLARLVCTGDLVNTCTDVRRGYKPAKSTGLKCTLYVHKSINGSPLQEEEKLLPAVDVTGPAVAGVARPLDYD
jgi:hypothetical protein